MRRNFFQITFLAGPLLFFTAACRPHPARFRAAIRPAIASTGRLVDAEGVTREGVLLKKGQRFDWPLPRGAGSVLRLSWAAPGATAESRLHAEIDSGSDTGRTTLVAHAQPAARSPSGAAPFSDESWKLPGNTGGKTLRFRLEPPGVLLLSDLRIARPQARAELVLLLVFDTTRRDAVGIYHCVDPSTPNLDAILTPGWRGERAYAAASWTIPSMASLMTGRAPAAMEDASGSPLGIPTGFGTVVEDFRRAGWETAAFVANPTLNAGNGFADGFTTFFTTPYEGASIALPATATLKHVPRWLAAHRGEPAFLYIHLLDPHDPYSPPDRRKGSTPFDPGYRGPITGDEVNALQVGERPRPSPEDLRHLQALYHDEVRFADQEFGKLWRSLPAEQRESATVIFTADHGEEFGEHGGWKHGPALYDEILRVPLAIRPGAGRESPGIAADSLVSLLDLRPTLRSLFSLGNAASAGDGRSLFDPGIGGREVLPAITMLTGGPPRAAVIGTHGKLFFFDRKGTRGIPNPVRDPPGYKLAMRLPKILPAFGRFDLSADPLEKNLLPADRRTLPRDWRLIEEAMSGTRNGVEMRIIGPAGTARISFSITGFSGSASWEPFALEENDSVLRQRLARKASLTASLDVGDDIDGFLFAGVDRPLTLNVKSSEPCAALTLGRPEPLSAGKSRTIIPAEIPDVIPAFEPTGNCVSIYIWKASGKARLRTPEEESEQVRRLRALGYLH